MARSRRDLGKNFARAWPIGDEVDQKVRDLKSESRSVCTGKMKKDCIVVWEYYMVIMLGDDMESWNL